MWNQYLIPNDLPEALQYLKDYRDRARIIAGGTDLVLDFSSKRITFVDALVDISSIKDLKKITLENGMIAIGSAVTFSEMLQSDLLKRHMPVLVDAARQIAGPQIRNIATIGGNVVNASPAADIVPSLLVLDSRVSITGPNQSCREVALESFLIGNRKVALEAGEIVTGFRFPVPDQWTRHYFRKVQPRQSMAIAMLSLAILLSVENGHISDARIAMGAVAPTAVRCKTVENELRNLPVHLAANPEIFHKVKQDIAPISDFRASRQYRLTVAQNLLQEAIVELLGLS